MPLQHRTLRASQERIKDQLLATDVVPSETAGVKMNQAFHHAYARFLALGDQKRLVALP
jgi:hypothetical protein